MSSLSLRLSFQPGRHRGDEMEIEYDAEANAIYITLREAEIADTKEITDDLAIDFDGDQRPVGIELLNVSAMLTPEDLAKVTIENLLPEATVR
jgi:uncharacterized protein YuzE